MKLPDKIWVSRKWIKHSSGGQKPDASFIEFEGAAPYIPASEAEALRERVKELEAERNIYRQEMKEAKDIAAMHEATMKALWGERFFTHCIEKGIDKVKKRWKERRVKAREALGGGEGKV